MRQNAATRRHDRLLQQIASCDMWKSLSLLQNFVAAICRRIQTGLNSCDISQRQNKRKQPCRSSSLDEATCRSDGATCRKYSFTSCVPERTGLRTADQAPRMNEPAGPHCVLPSVRYSSVCSSSHCGVFIYTLNARWAILVKYAQNVEKNFNIKSGLLYSMHV